MIGRLRQQGGAMVITVPNAIAVQMGWQVGNHIHIQAEGESVVLRTVQRKPRGRKSVEQLLSGIDCEEVAKLNESIADFNASEPKGNEIW